MLFQRVIIEIFIFILDCFYDDFFDISPTLLNPILSHMYYLFFILINLENIFPEQVVIP